MRARVRGGWVAYSDAAWSLWTIAGVEIWARTIMEGRDDETGRAA
jgi:hypothetical protein